MLGYYAGFFYGRRFRRRYKAGYVGAGRFKFVDEFCGGGVLAGYRDN